MSCSILNYYGGKQKMIKLLLDRIPPHKTYVEAFVGGGALFWRKSKSKVEVINDLNGFVSNFYRVVKNDYEALNRKIPDTLHCEFTYNRAREIYRKREIADPITMAWAFWIGCNMSFGGSCFDGSFQITPNCQDNSHPGVRSKNKRQAFLKIGDRLNDVMILNKDAIDVIKKYDSPETFIYCDPPYFQAYMGHYKGYTKEDFKQLLEAVSVSRSKILVSCYFDELIYDYGLNYELIEMNAHISPTKKKKIECLIYNYQMVNNSQKTLFD